MLEDVTNLRKEGNRPSPSGPYDTGRTMKSLDLNFKPINQNSMRKMDQPPIQNNGQGSSAMQPFTNTDVAEHNTNIEPSGQARHFPAYPLPHRQASQFHANSMLSGQAKQPQGPSMTSSHGTSGVTTASDNSNGRDLSTAGQNASPHEPPTHIYRGIPHHAHPNPNFPPPILQPTHPSTRPALPAEQWQQPPASPSHPQTHPNISPPNTPAIGLFHPPPPPSQKGSMPPPPLPSSRLHKSGRRTTTTRGQTVQTDAYPSNIDPALESLSNAQAVPGEGAVRHGPQKGFPRENPRPGLLPQTWRLMRDTAAAAAAAVGSTAAAGAERKRPAPASSSADGGGVAAKRVRGLGSAGGSAGPEVREGGGVSAVPVGMDFGGGAAASRVGQGRDASGVGGGSGVLQMRAKPRGAVADVLATSVSSLSGDELVSAADASAALSSSSELWDQALRGEAVRQGVENRRLGIGQGPVVRLSVTVGGDWGDAGAGAGGELRPAARLPLWENDARAGEASGWNSGSGSGLGIGAQEISEERAELLYQMFIAEQIYGDK